MIYLGFSIPYSLVITSVGILSSNAPNNCVLLLKATGETTKSPSGILERASVIVLLGKLSLLHNSKLLANCISKVSGLPPDLVHLSLPLTYSSLKDLPLYPKLSFPLMSSKTCIISSRVSKKDLPVKRLLSIFLPPIRNLPWLLSFSMMLTAISGLRATASWIGILLPSTFLASFSSRKSETMEAIGGAGAY